MSENKELKKGNGQEPETETAEEQLYVPIT